MFLINDIEKKITAIQAKERECKVFEKVPFGVNVYALLLTNKLLSFSGDGNNNLISFSVTEVSLAPEVA